MIQFILNDREVSTRLPAGMLVLDFIRYHKRLTATKIGCREGDCGACTVLIGDLEEGGFRYRSVTSCLTPLGNVHGKHVLTLEGLNVPGLNPVQQAFQQESASQCGFCTPGFIVSLSGFCLSHEEPSPERAIAAMSGNICRCTGYKSIERAAESVCRYLQTMPARNRKETLCWNGDFPSWLTGIPDRLLRLKTQLNGALKPASDRARLLGGGTDLYVQQHEAMVHADIAFLASDTRFPTGPEETPTYLDFPGNCTVTRMLEFEPFQREHDAWKYLEYRISSEAIRNIATLAGNLVNASPIGDLSIYFLAADAQIELDGGENPRWLPLRSFFKGYKKLDKLDSEWIRRIRIPKKQGKTGFEKICKRACLDIASVNSSLYLDVVEGHIREAGLSAGGVAPVPLFLQNASSWITGKPADDHTLAEWLPIVQQEISPISDVRGSADYKRLLLSQQVKSLFGSLVPDLTAHQILFPGL